MKVTNADKLCVFPGLQQVIGGCTILSNLIKLIIDIAKKMFCYDAKIDEQIKEKLKAYKQVLPNASSEFSEKLPSVIKLKEKKSKFSEHLKYIGIGIIRMTPVVATGYSSYIWYKAS